MFQSGRLTVFLILGTLVCGSPGVAAMAPIYRSLQSSFPSGKVDVNHLLLRTERAKEITWAQVSEFNRTQKGWVQRSNLLCNEDLDSGSSDWGYGFTRTSTEVRESAAENSKLIVLLPTETRLKITKTVGKWAQVSIDSSQGFVLLNNLITRIDFAGNPNLCFNSSMNSELRKEPFYASPLLQRIPFLGKVRRHQTQKSQWGYARLREHGDIWWPMEKASTGNRSHEEALSLGGPKIPTAELFQRHVKNMIQNPAESNFWIATADGVYRSFDALFWEKIPAFGTDAPPVAFSADGVLIVGTELSRDHGRTFESFVRWEKALNEIYRQQGRHPEHVKVLSIIPSTQKGSSTIALEVETGRNKKLAIETSDFGKTWRTR